MAVQLLLYYYNLVVGWALDDTAVDCQVIVDMMTAAAVVVEDRNLVRNKLKRIFFK